MSKWEYLKNMKGWVIFQGPRTNLLLFTLNLAFSLQFQRRSMPKKVQTYHTIALILAINKELILEIFRTAVWITWIYVDLSSSKPEFIFLKQAESEVY